MSNLLERLYEQWQVRSPRERALLALGLGVLLLLAVHFGAIRPLQSRLERATVNTERLEDEVRHAARLAQEATRLRADLSRVETRVAASAKTNLFTLLETLATRAGVKLESIKPKQPSGNASYPETRVEVSLKGTTLQQITDFLYRIETAPLHLIVRSLRIKSRAAGEGPTLLDISFSVSSFEHA